MEHYRHVCAAMMSMSMIFNTGAYTSNMTSPNRDPLYRKELESGSDLPSSRGGGTLKECGVCGDVAKSMHFGGLSCDSCKAFFRRSVQNNAYRSFSCPYEGNCMIGISSRKACQFCRFGKCTQIGMEKGWVMSEDERKKMMNQRREKKMKNQSSRVPESSIYALSEDDSSEISSILSLYKKSYSLVPYQDINAEHEEDESSSQNQVLTTWMTFCKRLAYFFSFFADFAELGKKDQSLLLKSALTSAGIIMGSVVYDSGSGKWADNISNVTPKSSSSALPSVSAKNVERLVPGDLISRVDKFFRKFQHICPDETMGTILMLVSLYSPELIGLEAREKVQVLQEKYIHILRNYVRFKFREKSCVMFPKAIVSLADIRELADRTAEMRIKNRPNSMFSGLLNAGAAATIGSPYSDLSFSQNMQSTSMSEFSNTPNLSDQEDSLYQRIMGFIYQMDASSSNTHFPTIIQTLKKLALSRRNLANSRAIAGCGPKIYRSSRHRSHYHNRGPSHSKSKRIGIKNEPLSDFPMAIKEEVMDESEQYPDLGWSGNESTQMYSESMSNQEYNSNEYGPQGEFSSFNEQGTSSTNNSNIRSHEKHYVTNEMHHYNRFVSPQVNSSGKPQTTNREKNCRLNFHSPQFGSQNGPVSPRSPFSPQLATTVNYAPPSVSSVTSQDSNSFCSSAVNSNSPYSSSSSSSSSPEIINNNSFSPDIAPENIGETEIEMLMHFLERVTSYEQTNLGTDNETDVLPLNLLKDFQNKLCRYSSDSESSYTSESFQHFPYPQSNQPPHENIGRPSTSMHALSPRSTAEISPPLVQNMNQVVNLVPTTPYVNHVDMSLNENQLQRMEVVEQTSAINMSRMHMQI